MLQEEAELGVVMDNMSAGQELLRQKEDRLKVLENALLGGLVSCLLLASRTIVKGNTQQLLTVAEHSFRARSC